MKINLLFVLTAVFVFTGLSVGQTKVITNADLEKFRQKRLAAEKEYRENYKQMGFPSPEELERQREKSARELSELAQRLRAEKVARHQLERSSEQRNSNGIIIEREGYSYPNQSFIDYGQYRSQTYVYPNYFNRRFFKRYGNRRVNRGRFFRFTTRNGQRVRRSARDGLIIRSDRRLNRNQRIQTRRGNRNLVLGVGVVRSGN